MKKYINIYLSSFISFLFFYILSLESNDYTLTSGYEIMFRRVETFSGNGILFARIAFFLLLIIAILNILKIVQMIRKDSSYRTYHFLSNILLMIFSVLYFLLPTMDTNTEEFYNIFGQVYYYSTISMSIYTYIFGIGALLISFVTLSSD